MADATKMLKTRAYSTSNVGAGLYLIEKGVIPAARDGADCIDVFRMPRHVEVLHHQQQRRPHS